MKINVIKTANMHEFIEEQKLLCEEFDSAYIQVKADDEVAIAVQTLNREPIVGIRKRIETGSKVAWYIYGGELDDSEENLFEIVTITQLLEIFPDVMPYLALEEGFRFMIDQDDYEDVWKADAL
ncbi:immunity protein Imm33 domain-containing protein [Acinetobacter rudis]